MINVGGPSINIGLLFLLSSFSSDPSRQLDVLRHHGDPFGMDGTEVGVLEEPHQVGLAGLLQGQDSRALEPEISLEILGNLPDHLVSYASLFSNLLC